MEHSVKKHPSVMNIGNAECASFPRNFLRKQSETISARVAELDLQLIEKQEQPSVAVASEEKDRELEQQLASASARAAELELRLAEKQEQATFAVASEGKNCELG